MSKPRQLRLLSVLLLLPSVLAAVPKQGQFDLSAPRFRSTLQDHPCESENSESACLNLGETKTVTEERNDWSVRCTWCEHNGPSLINPQGKKCLHDPVSLFCKEGKSSCHVEKDLDRIKEKYFPSGFGETEVAIIKRHWLAHTKAQTRQQQWLPFGKQGDHWTACLHRKAHGFLGIGKTKHMSLEDQYKQCFDELTKKNFVLGNNEFLFKFLRWFTHGKHNGVGMDHSATTGLWSIIHGIKESLTRVANLDFLIQTDVKSLLDVVDASVNVMAAWEYIKADKEEKHVKSNELANLVYYVVNRCDDEFRLSGPKGQLAQAGAVLFSHFVGNLVGVLGGTAAVAPLVATIGGLLTSNAGHVLNAAVKGHGVEQLGKDMLHGNAETLALSLIPGVNKISGGVKVVDALVKGGKQTARVHDENPTN